MSPNANRHDKELFFQPWALVSCPFLRSRGYGTVSPRSACPRFFFFSFLHSHVATPTEFTNRWVVSRNPAFPVIKHSLFLSIRDYGIFRIFFSTKTFYSRVYHDRITRQKMTSIRIIFEEKN